MAKAFGLAVILLSLASPLRGGAQTPSIEVLRLDGNTIIASAEISDSVLVLSPASDLYGTEARGWTLLDLPGGLHTGEAGSPRLPVLSAAMELPVGAEVEVSFSWSDFEDRPLELPLMPALPPAPKLPGTRLEISPDPRAYGRDGFYPGTLGTLHDAATAGGLARGHRLASLRFHPIQYNPAKGIMRVYRRVAATVRITDAGRGAAAPAEGRRYSREWEELIGRLCPETYLPPSPKLPEESYFDIFHGSSFRAAAVRLAEWKSRLGYKVRLADAGGWTSQALRDSIRLRQPLATYALLISDPNAGGADSLPASSLAQSGGFPTDLYYSETDGSGYLPDLFLGRLSVRTGVEADAAVDKIIRYQAGDFVTAGTAWIRKALFIAGYDASWQWLGRATNRYCHDILKREGYAEVDTLVMASGEEEGRIVSRLNQGRAWAVYTAHGNPVAWNIGYSSNFTVDEVNSLVQNDDMPAAVSGHCCNSGYFLYPYSDCFGEPWAKMSGRGGIAYLGSVPLTYWEEDDWLQRRYFDAIYDSVPGTPGLRLADPGRFVQYGLNWIDLNTGSGLKQYYFEAYHVLGDPSVEIWTGEPGSLTVNYPWTVPPGAETLSVAVADSASGQAVAGARVCAWSRADPSMHSVGFTDQYGTVRLPVSLPLLGDTVLLTATRHNYRPHLGWSLVRPKLNVLISSRSIVVNVPTEVSLAVTNPDSGGAPVCSLEVLASYNGSSPLPVAITGPDGGASFVLMASEGGYVALLGRRSGSEMFRDTIRVLAPDLPAVSKAYPNPAGRLVNVDLELPASDRVEVDVYNVLGQRVRPLFSGMLAAGYHALVWDGTDGQGRRCPSGVYFISLKAPGHARVPPRRVVLLR